MKVLICHRPGGAFGYISDGWINALQNIDVAVERWDGSLSTWHNFKPDLYVGCTGHKQPIPSRNVRGAVKVALHVNPYCDIKIEPNINETPSNIAWAESCNPDAVFGYGFAKDAKYWQHWNSKSYVGWIPMPTAGDATLYSPKHTKTIDLAYIGGYWPYKATNIKGYLLPDVINYNYKIYGWGKWPIPVSECTTIQKIDTLRSAKIGLCISEPHTTKYGIDLPERVFKTILCGAVAVHDKVASGSEAIKSVLWSDNKKLFWDNINRLLKMNNDDLYSVWKSQYSEIINNHTYHHRLSLLLNSMGFSDESAKLLKKVEELREV